MGEQEQAREKAADEARDEPDRQELEDLEADPTEAAKVRGGSIDPGCLPITGKGSGSPTK